MELEIKQNDQEIIVKFKNEKLLIATNSSDWNNEGISRFLTNLAIHTPDDEAIELKTDSENADVLYKHVCSLFESFIETYNNQKHKLL